MTRKRRKKNDYHPEGDVMKAMPLRQTGSLMLVICSFSLLLAQPLVAVEDVTDKQGQQEESFFETIKRKTREWLNWDDDTQKAEKETAKPTESQPDTEKSGGRKALESFKKGMNKISDNISESVERDKKNLKQRFEKDKAKPTESQPDTEKSGGRKALESFKKGMNKISDNISESVERDKKNLKQRFGKSSDQK